MPTHRDENLLLQLKNALLSTRDERKNPGSYEIFRPKDDVLLPWDGNQAFIGKNELDK